MHHDHGSIGAAVAGSSLAAHFCEPVNRLSPRRGKACPNIGPGEELALSGDQPPVTNNDLQNRLYSSICSGRNQPALTTPPPTEVSRRKEYRQQQPCLLCSGCGCRCFGLAASERVNASLLKFSFRLLGCMCSSRYMPGTS